MAENKKCPDHGMEFVELEGALRCPYQSCTHFIDIPARETPKTVERREDGRAERDEAFAMENELKQDYPKPKKKK